MLQGQCPRAAKLRGRPVLMHWREASRENASKGAGFTRAPLIAGAGSKHKFAWKCEVTRASSPHVIREKSGLEARATCDQASAGSGQLMQA